MCDQLCYPRQEFQLDLPAPGRYGTGLLFLDPESCQTTRFVGTLLI